MKSPKDIRDELLSAFLSVDDLYRKSPTDGDSKLTYLDIEMAEHLMNVIEATMFHYQEDIPEMRVKRKWGEEMVRADKLLKKYAEDLSTAKLKLDKKFDESGYLEQREFFGEVATKRVKLKRKI